jgi:hypothetical protein
MCRTVNDLFLSHHLDDEIEHCFTITYRGTRYYVCARCSFVLVGFLVSTPVHYFFPGLYPPSLLLVAFPDWILRCFRIWNGNNYARAFSGIILGSSYSMNVLELLVWRFQSDVWKINFGAVAVYLVTVSLTWRCKQHSGLMGLGKLGVDKEHRPNEGRV